MSIQSIREQIFSFHQSAVKLRYFYDIPTYMGLLNIGRSESQHSNFLKWLFGNSAFSQNSADSPIMHLLDIAVRRANMQGKIGSERAMSSELADSINSRSVTITNPFCYLEDAFKEKNSGKGRRSDIIIRCNSNLNICIENKVLSNEHDDQTEAYANHYKNFQGEWVFLYLTQLSSVVLDDYDNMDKDDKCKSKDFIQINYQDILNYILEPLLVSIGEGSRDYFILDDYIKTLRYPVMEEKVNKKTIMAMGQEETKLLCDFWEGNKELIKLAVTAMENNNNLDKSVQKEAKGVGEAIEKLERASEKDKTKYIIIINNKSKDDNNGKGYTKADVARKFAEKLCDLHKNEIIDEKSANNKIIKVLKTTRKEIFNSQAPNVHPIMLDNGQKVCLNTNIWGLSTNCWIKLEELLMSSPNDYFQIEAMI